MRVEDKKIINDIESIDFFDWKKMSKAENYKELAWRGERLKEFYRTRLRHWHKMMIDNVIAVDSMLYVVKASIQERKCKKMYEKIKSKMKLKRRSWLLRSLRSIEMIDFVYLGVCDEGIEKGEREISIIVSVKRLIEENREAELAIREVVLRKLENQGVRVESIRMLEEVEELEKEWMSILEKEDNVLIDYSRIAARGSDLIDDYYDDYLEVAKFGNLKDLVEDSYGDSYRDPDLGQRRKFYMGKYCDIDNISERMLKGTRIRDRSEIDKCERVCLLLESYIKVGGIMSKGYKICGKSRREDLLKEMENIGKISKKLKLKLRNQLKGVDVKRELEEEKERLKELIRKGWFDKIVKDWEWYLDKRKTRYRSAYREVVGKRVVEEEDLIEKESKKEERR